MGCFHANCSAKSRHHSVSPSHCRNGYSPSSAEFKPIIVPQSQTKTNAAAVTYPTRKVVPEPIKPAPQNIVKTSKSVPADDPTQFPKVGVHISVFKELWQELIEMVGEIEAKKLSTTDVSTILVKPKTNSVQLSYCQWLQSQNSELVGTATVFISHAWRFTFIDVFDAIQHYLLQETDRNKMHSYVWFDLFSNNQHFATQFDFSWWCTTFKSAIQQFGKTVMILAPWQDPIPLTRAWCIWEIYCTVITKSKFDIAMCEKEKTSFLEIVRCADENSINSLLSNIDTQNSQATNPEDWRQIQSIIARDIGFEAINHLVLDRLRSWVMVCILGQLKKERDEDTKLKLMLSRIAVSLGQGRLDELEPVRFDLPPKKTVLEDISSMLGLSKKTPTNLMQAIPSAVPDVDIPDGIIEPINPIADFNRRQCRIDNETGSVLKNAIQLLKKRQPPPPPEETLQLVKYLSYYYFQKGDYLLAKDTMENIIQECSSALGALHPIVLSTLNNLGTVFVILKQWVLAETTYADCINKKNMCLNGRPNSSLVFSLCNLSYVQQKLGKWVEAEAGYTRALQMQEQLTSEFSNSVQSIRSWLGYVYLAQRKCDDAEKVYEKYLEQEFLDRKDFNTVTAMNNLGKVYALQGNPMLAKQKMDDCVDCLLSVQLDNLGKASVSMDASSSNTDSLCTLRYAFAPKLTANAETGVAVGGAVKGNVSYAFESMMENSALAMKSIGHKENADKLMDQFSAVKEVLEKNVSAACIGLEEMLFDDDDGNDDDEENDNDEDFGDSLLNKGLDSGSDSSWEDDELTSQKWPSFRKKQKKGSQKMIKTKSVKSNLSSDCVTSETYIGCGPSQGNTSALLTTTSIDVSDSSLARVQEEKDNLDQPKVIQAETNISTNSTQSQAIADACNQNSANEQATHRRKHNKKRSQKSSRKLNVSDNPANGSNGVGENIVVEDNDYDSADEGDIDGSDYDKLDYAVSNKEERDAIRPDEEDQSLESGARKPKLNRNKSSRRRKMNRSKKSSRKMQIGDSPGDNSDALKDDFDNNTIVGDADDESGDEDVDEDDYDKLDYAVSHMEETDAVQEDL